MKKYFKIGAVIFCCFYLFNTFTYGTINPYEWGFIDGVEPFKYMSISERTLMCWFVFGVPMLVAIFDYFKKH